MTEKRLHELIAQGESLTVEFKREKSHPLSDEEPVEAIVSSAYPDSKACTHKRTEADLVEAHYQHNGRTRHLSAATYRRLGEPAAYIRRHGFEPIQQEQMILQYVEKHGRITRRDAAELCKISSTQAKRLLAKLCAQGKLTRRGQRKGAYYGRVP